MAKVTINDEYEVTYGLSIDTKIDDLELHKFEFSVNFAGFRRFRTQQLNE